MFTPSLYGVVLAVTLSVSSAAMAAPLTIERAVEIALTADPSEMLYSQRQQQIAAMGVQSAQLKDPMIKLGLANVPTDSFKLDQDAMTQLSVGVAQEFSRGNTRELNGQRYQILQQQTEYQAAQRRLELSQQIRQMWLNVRFSALAQQLLNDNKRLFERNVEHVRGQFELGYKQSQDLFQAELQLSKYDEQIAGFSQQEQAYRGQLAAWLGGSAFQTFDASLPAWSEALTYANHASIEHYELLVNHPLVQAKQSAIKEAEKQVEIANQSYKPAFKVEVGYGHRRSADMDGSSRPDLVSGFLSMDVPLFTDKRQDQSVISAERGKGIKQAERDLLLKSMNGMLNGQLAQIQNLKQRLTRYQQTLLPQAQANTQAAIQGYQSNTVNFDQVVNAFMDETALQLEFEQLRTQQYQALAQVRYFQAK
ncbi:MULTISPECIES: TolC family protein [unclassified Agarivorans]|uniref:TolC family protein n=1 Tax=unclassified Agarivorans TaxID=2636026 RepID=UPI0026E3FED1|nr:MULTISPECIES: TolC family protein [unclassified Agarivorans]MDO6684075.1 TolC family protein [Agarivorans sp. 3_MG-2023]MDO6714191.1 TolC family protein [Agarivorans sp. 2_MG-2023]